MNRYTDDYKNIEYTYTVHGDGFPVILIPGTLGDENLFEYIQTELTGYRVFVFDHLKIRDFNEMIDSYHILFTELLNLNYFVIGGSSVGGWISQHYTSKYPAFVRALIIGNSFSDNSLLIKKSMGMYRLSRIVPWFLLRKLFTKTIIKSVANYSEKEVDYFVKSLHNLGKKWLRVRLSWSLISHYKLQVDSGIPKLIIYTLDDSVVNRKITDILIDSYSEGEVIQLENGEHYPYRLTPDQYIVALTGFLNNLD